jgi:hypothetical protein
MNIFNAKVIISDEDRAELEAADLRPAPKPLDPKYVEWIKAYVAKNNDFVRGKCQEACSEMRLEFPELRAAAGFAHVTWGRDQHWWCVAPDGTIVDPTKAQFQFAVVLQYEELDLNDPSTRDLIPSGICPNCGGECYGGESLCSPSCERAYLAYLNNPNNY